MILNDNYLTIFHCEIHIKLIINRPSFISLSPYIILVLYHLVIPCYSHSLGLNFYLISQPTISQVIIHKSSTMIYQLSDMFTENFTKKSPIVRCFISLNPQCEAPSRARVQLVNIAPISLWFIWYL